MEKQSKSNCWVCGAAKLVKIKESDLDGHIDSNNFQITNSDYGITGELSKCQVCGFIQCTKETNVIEFYENLIDEKYENTREERKLQEIKILEEIKKHKPQGTLLDIGAGSGIMVEAALEMGYDAEGIEPSKWLQEQARKRNLPIKKGIFPMDGIKEKYDIITLVDVIEHVNNPFDLLKSIHKYLANDGLFIMITPDVDSLLAKIMKYKWWHFRVAHIGYFNKKTLNILSKKAHFRLVKQIRPSWYFSIEYLMERVHSYLPKILRIPAPGFLNKKVIPLNLRDSLLMIYQKENL